MYRETWLHCPPRDGTARRIELEPSVSDHQLPGRTTLHDAIVPFSPQGQNPSKILVKYITLAVYTGDVSAFYANSRMGTIHMLFNEADIPESRNRLVSPAVLSAITSYPNMYISAVLCCVACRFSVRIPHRKVLLSRKLLLITLQLRQHKKTNLLIF